MEHEARPGFINPLTKAELGGVSPFLAPAKKPPGPPGKTAFLTVFFTFFCLFTAFAGQVFAVNMASKELPRQIVQAATAPDPQTPVQPEDSALLLQKLLNPDPQVRAAASQSLSTIPPDVRIPSLTRALSDPNWKIQTLAAFHLGQMGAEARGSIPSLTEAMNSANPDVRFTLAKALGKIGSAAAVPPLAQALQDKDENVRMASAEALNKLGPDAQAALPALQKTIRDGNWFVRTHAAAAFVRLAAQSQPMLPLLIKSLGNPLEESPFFGGRVEYHLRRQAEIPAVLAIDTLAGVGPEVVPSLLAALKNQDNRRHYFSNLTVALMTIGSQAGNAQVIESLMALFNNAPASERRPLLHTLGQIGKKLILGKEPIHDKSGIVNPALTSAFGNHQWQIRTAALAAMVSDSPDTALPYVDKALGDQDWRVRSLAAATLGQGYSDQDKIVDLLTTSLNDKNQQVRLNALGAVNRSEPITPLLLNLLQDENQDVRLAAAIKLAGKSELAETILINTLKHHQDPGVRLASLEALEFNPSDLARSTTIKALQDASSQVRAAAAYALMAAGASVVPALTNALHDENAQVRLRAVLALREIGSPGVEPALTAALDDADEGVRSAAGAALGKFKSAIYAVEKNLHHEDWLVQRQTAEKLGVIGFNPANISAPPVPALLKALQDQNPNVRASVAAALIRNSTESEAQLPPAIASALKQALPQLLDSLKNGDPQARLDAIFVLRELGLAARPAIPALREALKDENWLIRYSAAVPLLKINPQDAAVVPVLTEIFRDPQRAEILSIENDLFNHDELSALGKIGSTASLSVLINLLQVSDEKLRYTHYLEDGGDRPAVARILIKVGPKAIPALIAALKNDNVRFLAADVLGQIGPQAISPLMAMLQPRDGVEPAVQEIIRDQDADRRRSAVYALGQIGRKYPAQKRAISKILAGVMHNQGETADVRWLAAAALMKMGENVDLFFGEPHLPKPADDACILSGIEYEDLHSGFDLYAARCLFSQGGRGAGSFQLYQLVRGLMNKTPSKDLTRPELQPSPLR